MTDVADQRKVNQSYRFKWSDYQNHLSDVVRQLLEEDCMVDVTLSAAGQRIHAHRIVLCACSTLFQELLSQVTEDYPTIILSDISPEDVKSIIEFIYHGEVRIPVDNINSLLEAAQSLKIGGLVDINGFEEKTTKNVKGSPEETVTEADKIAEENAVGSLENDLHAQSTIENYISNKKKKRRRETAKRDYSDDMLASAINDLKLGQTLIEAATKHNIPRSTLYMRAKALGIHLSASRNEYPAECMSAAITAVISGSSLQHASEMFRIPKTVLWRRIQKEGYQVLREAKRSYALDTREAAVKALERGENLTKVALEFKIPKTTLFRDKARLVDQGKLPLSFWKKRKTENEELKKLRLEEAVAACKGGKMSQAAASMTYRIPKTTIWRRLQQEGKKMGRLSNVKKRQHLINKPQHDTEIKIQEDSSFSYCEVSSEIPITYIDENSIPEDSVIILATEGMEQLNFEEGRQIIVNAESGQEYIPCTISIEDSSNYSESES